jgi:outer membrane protein OmpA-like peptidoglycan-associated protein/osmotically-inducible protein OsmY
MGLFPLILFGLFVGFLTKGTIEKDLEKRSVEALKASGIMWAKPAFKGLEGTIKGEAPTEEARLEATKIVRGVWGVRSVADQLSISKIISPYTLRTFHGKEKLVLEGYVPSDKIRQSVIGVAKAQFPNVSLVDKLEIARGAPDDTKWFGQVSYALGQLAKMKKGHFIISDKKLDMEGAAMDSGAFNTLNETLAGILPLKMTAGKINIEAPLVENYNFSSNFSATELVINGIMPTAASVAKVVTSAKTYFPNLSIKNNVELGSGAPKNWDKAVLLSLAELSKLEQGSISLNKLAVTIEGLAATKEQAQAIRKTVRSAYPTGYKVTDNIKVKVPDLPLTGPFELRTDVSGSKITLTGVISSEAERNEILNLVKAEFPNGQIDDQLTLARGAPDNFLTSVITGLKMLKSLNNAQMLVSDNQLTVTGDTTDEALANRLDQKPANLPENFTWVNGVKFDDSLKKAEEAQKSKEKAKEEADRLAAEKAAAEAKAATEAKEEAERKAKEAAEKAKAEKEAEEARLKAEEARLKAEAEAAKNITSKEELEKRKNWLTPEQTKKRLVDIHKESGAVNAKECQLLMNSLVRGNAIRFSVNSSVITSSSYDILSKVHTVADRCTNTVIRVEGHTDKDGSDAYNLQLSKRRAQSVVNYLIKLGIPRTRLDTKGFGEKKPVASNRTQKGKALNRRIEFIVFEN